MDARTFTRALTRSWPLIAATFLAGLALAIIWGSAQQPKFTAHTDVFISVGTPASTSELNSGSSYTRSQMQSFGDTMTTAAALQPVIDDLSLSETVASLAARMTVTSSPSTSIVTIAVEYPSAYTAAAIADAVADSFSGLVTTLVPGPDVVGADGTIASMPSPVSTTVLQPAVVPDEPSSPVLPVAYLIGAMLGLIVGLVAALLRDLLDTRIRSAADIVALTGVPVIGRTFFDKDTAGNRLVLRDEPLSSIAEPYRSIRTNLSFISASSGSRSFVLTSAMPGEGKSTTSANLALAAAATGASVVLLDGDLRRPRVADYFGLVPGAGVSDVIIGRAELDDVLQPAGDSTLSIMSSGTVPPNPSELLGSTAMGELLARLEEEFDYVFVDSPPLLPVTDAAVISSIVGNTIVVVSAAGSRAPQLAAALDTLERAGVHATGIVLSMLPPRGADAYEYVYEYKSAPAASPLRSRLGALVPQRQRTAEAASAPLVE